VPTIAALRRLRELPKPVQIGALICLAVVIVGCSLFTFSRDNQSALFARALLPEQLSDVEAHLAAWNVPFSTTADNVRVASARKNETLLRLSLAGVPRLHIADSSETLAKVGALEPQAILEAQTRDGLAGDIALGLRGIAGIADARVIIAPASPGYFADETSHAASASVRLVREPGAQLSPETINGIKAFVAAGVPGLDQEHVAVVDDRGVALNGRASNGDGEATQLQTSIQSALDEALGNGRAIVRAHIDVDDSANVQRETKRTPIAGTAIEGQTVDEHYSSDKKRYSKVQSQSDRGSDVVVTERDSAAGRPQRVSIAVFLDRRLASEIPLIRSLVQSAGGIDFARGDTVSVEPLALAGTLDAAPSVASGAPAAHAIFASFLPVLPPAIVLLAVLGLLFLLSQPLGELIASLVPKPEPLPFAPVPALTNLSPEALYRRLTDEPPHAAAAVIGGLSTPDAAAVLDLYPAELRREIIGRLARPRTPLAADLSRSVANA
jgi:flagellar M-ring protein FliF